MNTSSFEIPANESSLNVSAPEIPFTSRTLESHANHAEYAGDARAIAADPRKGGRRRRIVIVLSALVVGIAAAGYYWTEVAPFESTDDAFVESDVTPIAPQVSGRVVRLLVGDNQEVKQGDVLLEIDPSDYQTRLDQARANRSAANSHVAQARAQLAVDQAKVEQEKANVVAAVAEARNAEADLKRDQDVGPLGISASQLDLAATRVESARAALAVARNRERSADAGVDLDTANIQTAVADLGAADAAVRQAELDVDYTRITAPAAGFVTHRAVQLGAYVQTGQPLLALVPRKVWIVANFKETQLTHMRPGQPVEVSVDAYPAAKFTGHVDSIQAGAGARFSVMPPENASGNFVKVVQRVPVKIVLDRNPAALPVLGPGMSVVPEVRVR